MCMCATYGCIWTLDIVCAYANKKDQNNMWSCAAHLRDCDCMDHTHANTHTHTHTPSQDAMDLPDDKRQVVIQTSEEKKWQMVRDNTRRRRNIPPTRLHLKAENGHGVRSKESSEKSRREEHHPGVAGTGDFTSNQ